MLATPHVCATLTHTCTYLATYLDTQAKEHTPPTLATTTMEAPHTHMHIWQASSVCTHTHIPLSRTHTHITSNGHYIAVKKNNKMPSDI